MRLNSCNGRGRESHAEKCLIPETRPTSQRRLTISQAGCERSPLPPTLRWTISPVPLTRHRQPPGGSWDEGLATRPGPNGQTALPLEGNVPILPDFTAYVRMAGEYEVMGIYPQVHLREFIRPKLGRGVLPTTVVCGLGEGTEALVADWPITRQHPKGGRALSSSQSRTGRATFI